MSLLLHLLPGGRWRIKLPGGTVRLTVAGTDLTPHRALAPTVRDLVARWPEVQREIEAFVRALDPGTRVKFLTRSPSWDLEQPTHAVVGFSTGLPDGYVMFEVELEAGRPRGLTAVLA